MKTANVPLYRLAHSRTGDKGDISNISLIAWDAECYEVLLAEATEARVAQWFAYRKPTRVTRYLLPGLQAMNFVLEGVLDGGRPADIVLVQQPVGGPANHPIDALNRGDITGIASVIINGQIRCPLRVSRADDDGVVLGSDGARLFFGRGQFG